MKHAGFEIDVDRMRDLLTVRYTGTLTLDVAERAVDAGFGHPGVTAATLVLIDATLAQVHEVDVNWFRSYQAFRASRGYPAQTTALVVSRDEGHQLLGQLWAAIRATAAADAPGVFTDESAAIEWLLERRAAPDAGSMSA